MTKNLNFALKMKGGGREGGTCEVLRPCHPPQNLERAPSDTLHRNCLRFSINSTWVQLISDFEKSKKI